MSELSGVREVHVSGEKAKVRFSELIKPALRHRLFGELQQLTQLNDGQVSWSIGEEVDQYISVLSDAFTFPAEISRREAAFAVWRGILDARKTGVITDRTVLESLQRLTDKSLSETIRTFSMWTRLSFRPPAGWREKAFTYTDVTIKLASRLPTYMQLSEDQFAELQPNSPKDKPGFAFLIARTSARNPTQAADKIFDATEIFQAMYNLALKPWNIFGSEQKPEALLVTGPYYFFFRERTRVGGDNWFNQNFSDDYWRSSDSKTIFGAASTIRKMLEKLETHPLREPISASLLMMNDGMEASDMSHRTLRYWTALERLFQAGDERVSYERIIERATYLDDPADLARAKLRRLMRIRNSYVHMGASENQHHQLTQYLAAQVRSHLFYLLINGDDFADHREFIEMTDLPSSSEALQRRRRAIDRRERMIDNRRHRGD